MKDSPALRRARPLTPEFEHDFARDPRLGYEAPDGREWIRCVAHGSPTPLERWHCHDEYELQLIVDTHGQAFVGDYVGHFEPGHLVLTGPRLPHNWVSADLPPDGLATRSLVIQFLDKPLREGMRAIRELEELQPLLDKARHGIEFFGLGERVRERFQRLRQCHGLRRFVELADLLCLLQHCGDYRLLSSTPVDGTLAGDVGASINAIVDLVHERYAEPLSTAEAAAHVHMSESRFSRAFGKATGSTFGSFVSRVRVQKACELLMHTDRHVSTICYEVGFNNIANFNRRFREAKGMTPREFRAQGAARLGPSVAPAGPEAPTRH
ncbi:MAG TPA: AraC family transcriptional regulator [Burkholderiaceae bacterium]